MTPHSLVESLETDRNHSLSPEKWAALLARLLPDEYCDPPPSRFASKYLPGSAEKIGLMAKRVEQGHAPCHPNDVRWIQADEVARETKHGKNGCVIAGRLKRTGERGIA